MLIYKKGNHHVWNETFAIACSGGADSMAVTEFIRYGRRSPILLHVNHSTGNDAAQKVVETYAKKHGLELRIHTVDPTNKKANQSWEEFWRIERMEFFFTQNIPVITGHNLDDAMETWMFGAMHGQPKLIPYQNKNIYRPFILNRKQSLLDYVIYHNIEWAEDQSNQDTKFARNRIRHEIMPEVLKINEGFATTIKNKYLKDINL